MRYFVAVSCDCLLARAALIGILCAVSSAAQDEIARAVASPSALMSYLKSHSRVDWTAITKALGVEDLDRWSRPCGRLTGEDDPCAVDRMEGVPNGQSLVRVRAEIAEVVVYLRYLKEPRGNWRFAGLHVVDNRNTGSSDRLFSAWNKPFLAITSDSSQNGIPIQQVLEEWFDLTQPGFTPAFSFTPDGGADRWAFGVSRSFRSSYRISRRAVVERIELTVDLTYEGIGLDQKAIYRGLYERNGNRGIFQLVAAYVGANGSRPFPTRDFADLADPFSRVSDEMLIAYALPGLRTIAQGSNRDARQWLTSVLDHAGDSQAKRELLDLMNR